MPPPEEPGDRGSLSTLFTSLVEESADAMVVVHDDGSIRYMNAAAGAVTGWDPEEGRGRSIFGLVHPEDVDRAIYDLSVHAAPGAPPGWSSYRVLTGDGSWLTMQLTTAEVSDGSHHLVATYCRAADVSAAEVLFGLLRGKSPVDALHPVLDMFNRKVFGSRVAITWIDDAGVHHLGTDVPAELAGADDDPGSPWAISRASGEGHRSHDLAGLDEERRALAARHELGAYWIEPVVLEHGDSYALITVWTRVGGPPPEYHSSGMRAAKDFVELVLRWTRQVELLDSAAHRDALTGLANRKAFFDSLSEGDAGAVLYCDLDRFKPVNDELGHRAGDELLSAVAGRIEGCVRAGDIVARLGGDEFAVLCEGATEAQAAELAERIRAAIEQPFEVGGATARVGISIGVAHVTSRLGDAVLESADRALYQAKAEGGSTVRWNEPVAD